MKRECEVTAALARELQMDVIPRLRAKVSRFKKQRDVAVADAVSIIKKYGDAKWRRITKELKQRVLVTNNIDARDARGGMSHVWIGFIVKSADPKVRGKFMTFDDGDMAVCGLTHYCEIPLPVERMRNK